MTFAIPKRRVLQGLTPPNCPMRVAEITTQNIRVEFMSCCIQKISPCIPQGADKTLSFYDASTVDYSLATEITFDVWETVAGGVSLLSKSLSGATITLVNDYTFTLTISDVESGALTKGSKHCEAWVTAAGGERYCVGAGQFKVVDTRKFD
mgnify:CR=1 FL=1